MRHTSDFTVHLLTRIAQDAQASAREQLRISSELVRIRRTLTGLVGWLKRVALLVALYGSGGLLILMSDEKAELLIRLVEAARSK